MGTFCRRSMAASGKCTRSRHLANPALFLALLVLMNPLSVWAAPSVGQWDRFEVAVENDKQYGDPFRDVLLDVTVLRPDGAGIDFWGFYDGDRTWKIRFMPDQIGEWQYVARFSDGSPGVSGVFECAPSDIPGMICRDETNPIWLGFKGGNHVLIRSLHCGDRLFADVDNSVTGEKWSPAMRRAFLDWTGEQGYNMLSVASHYLNREVDGRGRGWNTPDLWDGDTQRPKPDQFRRMESVLNDLAHRRICVFPFAGFFGQSSDFPTDHADQELYVRYALARVGAYWNMMLNVAGPEPIGRNQKFQNAMSKDDIDRLGTLIDRLDVYGHLLTVHNPGNDTYAFMASDWSDFVTVQGLKDRDWSKTHAGLLKGHRGKKPVYAQEVFWPGNTHGHGEFTDDEIRKKAFTLMMAATTINFGDMNGDSSSGFSGSLDLAEKVQKRHDIVKSVWDFFESIPFYRLSPRQDLVDNGFCLAETGKTYLVYLPEGGDATVSTANGPYNAVWINPQNTADRRPAAETRNSLKFRAPADGADWLLYITAPTP
jgi:hypothetical protein